MQYLTPMGLSEDGKRLLLLSPAGEEFAVPVDTRLRAALRGDNERPGQLEKKMESALRPRDIQSRIRAGESPEDVAAAARTTVEAIMAFATPVLAERAHVAHTALKASIRRRSGESSSAGRTLGEAAELFFSDHKLHDEDVEWDAWRTPDSRWMLVATYAVAGRARTAEFSHDLPGRYVVAENDEARILTGEVPEPEARQPAGGRTVPSRRLSAVPSQEELPLGDDAIELVRDHGTETNRVPAADEPTELADFGQEVDAELVDPGPEAVVEPTLDPALDPAADPAIDPEADTAIHTGDADWIAQEPTAADPADEERRDAGPATEPATEPSPEDPAPPKRKSRSSVPSWDEIMFGGGKNE